jgi:hypothetical protein
MTSRTAAFDCQNAGNASTGTLGTNTQRLYVDNPSATSAGWNLTIAASAPTATWTSGGNSFDFNDNTSSGCTDGADTDAYGGQMSMDPSVGTINPDCTGCNLTGLSVGSVSSFQEGVTNQITLMSASNTSSSVWRGYLTGVSVSQTVPAQQAGGNYTIPLTLTVVSN